MVHDILRLIGIESWPERLLVLPVVYQPAPGKHRCLACVLSCLYEMFIGVFEPENSIDVLR